MQMYTIRELFDLTHTQAKSYLLQYVYPWEALQGLKEYILQLGKALPKTQYTEITPCVWAHNSVKIAPSAHVDAPCIIGEGTEIRQGAFIRGSALIGKNCVVGNSTEVKNAILFDNVQAPHYNYVGDSILGYKSHLGAGAITSNVKGDKTPVVISYGEKRIQTLLKKVGAFLGDYVEVGCNSVLNPGSIIGRNTQIYPLSFVRGVVPANSIFKGRGDIVKKGENNG